MKKAIAILLFTAILIGTMSSCAGSLQKEYMLKGDFFNMLLTEMNYYPIDSSWDEMNEADNYSIEARTMADWGLLSGEEAFKGLDKPITKEVALVSLLNTMYFSKTGNIDSVKDAKMSSYPQEMANAVASGITGLDSKNCINAKQKLTYEECVELIDNTSKAEADGHFEENEGKFEYDFGENSVVLYQEDIIDDEYFKVQKLNEEESKSYRLQNLSLQKDSVISQEYEDSDFLSGEFEKPVVSFLGTNIGQLNTQSTDDVIRCITILTMSTRTWDLKIKNKINEDGIVVYDPAINPKYYEDDLTWNYSTGLYSNLTLEPFAGKYMSHETKGTITEVTLGELTDIEIMQNIEVQNFYKRQSERDSDNKFSLCPNDSGFDIGFKYDKKTKMYSITAKTTLKFDQNLYDDWRDAKRDTELTLKASIGDFSVNLNDVKYLFKDRRSKDEGKALLSVQFKTQQEATLKFEALKAPTNNGNGKFFSNLSRSRWNNSGQGAKAIKIAKLDINLGYGVYLTIWVYLRVTVEGRYEIVFSQTNGFRLVKEYDSNNESHLHLRPISERSKREDINASLRVALGCDICLNFTLVKNIFVYEVEAFIKVSAAIKAYYENKLELDIGDSGESSDNNVFDHDTFLSISQNDIKFGYSIDIVLSGGFKAEPVKSTAIGSYKNLLYDYLPSGAIKLITFGKEWELFHIHHEANLNADLTKMTKNNQDSSSEDLDDRFQLEKTKLHVDQNSAVSNAITFVPDKETLTKNRSRNIKVRVNDKNIATAKVYDNGETQYVLVYGNSAGSTEIEIYYKENKSSKEQYSQTFSITVDTPKTALDAYNAGGSGYSSAGGGTDSFGFGGTVGAR